MGGVVEYGLMTKRYSGTSGVLQCPTATTSPSGRTGDGRSLLAFGRLCDTEPPMGHREVPTFLTAFGQPEELPEADTFIAFGHCTVCIHARRSAQAHARACVTKGACNDYVRRPFQLTH